KRRIDLDQEGRLHAEMLGAIAVTLLDAALGVEPVAAHVPRILRASRTRHGVGPPHDPRDEVSFGEAGAFGRVEHTAERFMSKDEAILPGRRPAIESGGNFAIGAANTERERLHQHRAFARRRLGDGFKADGISNAGADGQGTHTRNPMSRPHGHSKFRAIEKFQRDQSDTLRQTAASTETTWKVCISPSTPRIETYSPGRKAWLP